MSRRNRSTAFLSATALLAGATLSLALAPAAVADIPTPPLGTLTAAPSSPEAGELVRISGDGCFTLATRPTSAPDATADAAGTDAAVAPAAAPAGSVSIVITGPGSFRSTDTATASDDGTWTADQGITLGDAGDYSVNATCTLTDPVLDQQVTFDYDTLPLEVSAPPQVINPAIACNGCSDVNPGGTVTIGGTGFPANTTATVSLAGYSAKTSGVDAQGGFEPVSIIIKADQAAGTLSGQVAAPGADPVAFTVRVTVPQPPGGSQDGDVPGAPTDTTTGSTDPGTDTTVFGGDTDTSGVTSSAPQLPQTGTDSVWPGVVGGLLVLTGGGLLWLGRRREESDTATA